MSDLDQISYSKNQQAQKYWWQRDDLHYTKGVLHFANKSIRDCAKSLVSPAYLYSWQRIEGNLGRLHEALNKHSIEAKIFYAMKANRFPPILQELQKTGLCGIDACSPGEVDRAVQCGFSPEQISYTGTALSDADLEALSEYPEITVNLDSLSALRRWGQRFPHSKIGLRINPEIGMGYGDNSALQYAGTKETKFGIYINQMEEALHIAQSYHLTINGLHCHAGCGYLTVQKLSAILAAVDQFIRQLPPLDYINLGGGLGIPLVAEDAQLDLKQWCAHIQKFAKKHSTLLCFEPGDYIVKDAGILLTTVTMVERKRATRFIGINAGFNTHIEPAFYSLPLEPVPLQEATTARSTWEAVTLSGNINEAHDLFAQNIKLPPINEGDCLCLLNAGGYGASMASGHCLRPLPAEFLLS